uniref:Guanylate-binding protein 6-like n=1 Tax=Jaculus jaculus TaxID=51337 RepID=A0A8C5P3G0_JACJA
MASGLNMPAPICLVENRHAQLSVNQRAIQILDKISQPVVVVAIAGLYRTGKSYLMNRLAGQNRGFPLGSTVQSETKGIWMWCVPHSTKPNHTLVLLDTEGLGDVEKVRPRVLGPSYVTELTELIRTKTSSSPAGVKDSAEFVSFFPDFVWTIRDFMLELKLQGRPITEDEYLENALKLVPGNNPKIQASNLPRECIRYFFPKRKCFVFDRPTFDRNVLLNIENASNDQLDPKFQEQTSIFLSYIFTCAKTKTLRERIVVTGSRLGTLVTTYVDAINSGTVPCLENAVTTLAQRENSMAVQKAADRYSEQMAQRLELPTDTLQELLDVHMACEKEAIAVFMEHSFKDENREFQKTLMELIERRKADVMVRNEEASNKYCQQELTRLAKSLTEGISTGRFSMPGGHKLYLATREKLEQDYWQVPRKGVKAKEALQRFLQSQAAVESSILQADTALTDGEKALAAERAQKEAAEQEQELLRQKQKEQQQLMEDRERSHRENIEQLKAKLIREREELLRDQAKMMDHKMQRALLEEGFKKKSDKIKEEINHLKNNIEAITLATAVCAPVVLAVEAVKGIASLF